MLGVVLEQRPEFAFDEGLQSVVIAQEVQESAQAYVGESVVGLGRRVPGARCRVGNLRGFEESPAYVSCACHHGAHGHDPIVVAHDRTRR